MLGAPVSRLRGPHDRCIGTAGGSRPANFTFRSIGGVRGVAATCVHEFPLLLRRGHRDGAGEVLSGRGAYLAALARSPAAKAVVCAVQMVGFAHQLPDQ